MIYKNQCVQCKTTFYTTHKSKDLCTVTCMYIWMKDQEDHDHKKTCPCLDSKGD